LIYFVALGFKFDESSQTLLRSQLPHVRPPSAGSKRPPAKQATGFPDASLIGRCLR
jgi:hypothetical protein